MENSSKLIQIKKYNNIWLVIVTNDNKNIARIIKMSTRKGKKYDVFEVINKDGKPTLKYILSFGSAKNFHYKDILGGYDELDHNDEQRRINFYKRFKNANNAKIDSPLFWSANLLW